jgi:two-component system chemotaxis response regulator CheY
MLDKNIKILIVDDSSFMRSVLKDILVRSGFTHFVEAENGKEAIEKFNVERPGLILLDIVMPEMSGIEVLKQVGRITKVIVISAVGQEAMVEEAKQLGARGYIIKPFDEKAVLDEISKVAS